MGNLTRRVDPGGDCSATPKVGCVTYSYDVGDELTGIDYSDATTPDVTGISYDLVGRRTAMTDGTGTSTWSWDSLGRLTSSTSGATVPGGGQTVGYGYDLAGRLTSIAYPGGGSVSRGYDPAGNLTSVTDPAGRVHTFSYDPDDNLETKTFANTTAEAWTYDRADRVTDINATKAGSTFARFTYGRDAAGQLGSVTSTGVPADNHTYGYTQLNQLGSVDTSTYIYDPADNLSTQPGANQAFDAANQLCHTAPTPGPCASPPPGATTFGYDSRGNRTTVSPPGAMARTFTYDQANRLAAVPAPAGGAGAIVAGAFHSLAIRPDGTAASWGRNLNGQLGDGTTTARSSPVTVTGLSGVTGIAAGATHSLAIVGGAVKAWGANTNGKLGDNTTTQRLAPVAVVGLSGVSAVAAGANHSMALRSDGTVWAWGRNTSGQLGDGTVTARKVPVQVPGLVGITAIAAGDNYSMALRADGTVVAWGLNTNGQLGDGTTTQRLTPVSVSGLSGVTAIAAGAVHGLAVMADGTARAWGSNGSGRLGDGTTTQRLTPVAVVGLAGVTAVDGGANHSLAVVGGGAVKAWGANTNGKLGDGTTTTRKTPVAVVGLSSMTAVGAGTNHSLARASDATAKAWGLNTDGQLGDGTTTQRTTPVAVSGFAAGAGTTYAYNGDGLRMAKTTGTVTTAFTYSAASTLPLLLTEGTSAALTTYVYGPGDAPLERIDVAGNALYYHQDQLGSTRVLTDSSGNVTGTYTYDAYGKRTASTGLVDQPLGFTGQYTDSETGFLYLRARHYDPTTGLFTSVDPVLTKSQARYGYLSGNPTGGSDPSGLYQYQFDWTIGNFGPSRASDAIKLIISNPNAVFPFPVVGEDGESGLLEGHTYDLFTGINRPCLKGLCYGPDRITVISVGPNSFEFKGLSGHIEGTNSRIRFTTCIDDNGMLHLRQSASGHTPYDILPSVNGRRRSKARDLWSEQADNLRDTLAKFDRG